MVTMLAHFARRRKTLPEPIGPVPADRALTVRNDQVLQAFNVKGWLVPYDGTAPCGGTCAFFWRSCFRVIWRTTLRRGLLSIASGRDRARPSSNTVWLRLKAGLGGIDLDAWDRMGGRVV